MRPYIMLFLIFQIFEVSLSRQVPCKVELEQGVQYRRITWYKVSVRSDMLVGLVMKDIRSNKTQLYKFVNHSYQIGDDLSLLHVPEHSPEECEIYRCSVWPPVGHRILQSDYILPQGCSAVQKTEISSQLQGTQEIYNQCIIISGFLLVSFLVVSVLAVCLCKRKKTHTQILLPVII